MTEDALRNAEAGLLSSMIKAPDQRLRLRESDFCFVSHKAIFTAMVACIDRDGSADLVTVITELSNRGTLETAGGMAGVNAILGSSPSSHLLPTYERIVRAAAKKRQAIRIAETLKSEIEAGADDDAIIRAAAELEAVIREKSGEKSRADKIADFAEWVEKRADGGLPGIPTGFKSIDHYLGGGIQPGWLVILAARPGMGKTSLALNLAVTAAKAGRGAVLLSLEMPHESIYGCLAARFNGMDARRIFGEEELTPEEEDALIRIGQELEQMEIDVYDDSSTLSDVLYHIRNADGKLVIIDHIQLIKGPDKENRVQEMSLISREIKAAALASGTPVLALSQLNRGVEARQDKRPALSDLRESGSLEQDADAVLMMYRDGYYTHEESTVTELSVMKNRLPTGGAGAVINLYFWPERLTYAELSTK